MPDVSQRQAGIDFDWMDVLATSPHIGEAALAEIASWRDPVINRRLKGVQQSLRRAGRAVEESLNRNAVDKGRLFEQYREGSLWLVCEFDVFNRSVDKRAALACRYAHRHSAEGAAISVAPRGGDAGQLGRRDEQPMLVDVAELVQCPEGFALPTLVCLYFLGKEVLDAEITGAERSLRPDFASKAISVVGEGETGLVRFAGDWVGKGYRDVIKGASQISDGVADQRVDALVRLMERIKDNFNAAFPMVRFKPQAVEICHQKGSDLGLYLRNMVACST